MTIGTVCSIFGIYTIECRCILLLCIQNIKGASDVYLSYLLSND